MENQQNGHQPNGQNDFILQLLARLDRGQEENRKIIDLLIKNEERLTKIEERMLVLTQEQLSRIQLGELELCDSVKLKSKK